MEVKAVIDALKEIKAANSTLTNDEILKIMELKVLMEIKAGLWR